jgi:transcriptional regulator with PAS, ATPase and Fis domain
MGGSIIDLPALRRPARSLDHRRLPDDLDADLAGAMAKLRDRRARLLETVATRCEPGGCGPCTYPEPCEGYRAIDDVLEVVAGAEGHLISALERAIQDASALAQLTAATHEIAVIDAPNELIEAIPRVALVVGPGAAAALMQVRADGAVETLSRSGAPFETQSWRVAEEARGALREAATNGRGSLRRDATRPSHRPGRLALVPLTQAAEGLALALERTEASAPIADRDMERLAVYASFANEALVAARARAALREASARDAATLGAIRDGVIAVDGEGVVRALNQAAGAVLGVRREEVLGRRLADVPGLAAVAIALAGPTGQVADVVALPRGDIVLRSQAYEGGVVATLRDAATEQTIAHRMVGSVARYTFEHLIGASTEFQRVMQEADRAAQCDVPVLVFGESGTGKEMLAQAIHNASSRASEPFLGINVTAIPRELLESELFGYEGGTFTGARASGRAGKFELAGRGTLLLDEIGDMPLEMQGKLLRVLQERIVQRLGSARDIPVRARIIATTHRDLGEAVEQGRFRLDLYHRLRVLQLRLPPLRERRGDVPLLVERQLQCHAERTQRRITIAPHVLTALEAHDWPGNVRELQNVIEGELSVLAPGESTLTRIPPVLLQPRVRPPRATPALSEIVPLEEVERQACEGALAACNGNVARAARALGVAKGTLYSKIKRYGIVCPAAE